MNPLVILDDAPDVASAWRDRQHDDRHVAESAHLGVQLELREHRIFVSLIDHLTWDEINTHATALRRPGPSPEWACHETLDHAGQRDTRARCAWRRANTVPRYY